MSETEKTVEVVYVGLRRITGGKAGHWYEHPDGTDFGGWAKPLSSAQRIGSLLAVQVIEREGGRKSVWTSGEKRPRVVGVADVPPEKLATWQVENDLIRTADAQAATERRLAREVGTPLDDAIELIRRSLDGLPWHQRAAAVHMIVSRLR